MGLSPYSNNPCDAGILCMILVKTAMYVSLMKQTILHLLSMQNFDQDEQNSTQPSSAPAAAAAADQCPNYMEEFRSRTPTLRYDSVVSSCGSSSTTSAGNQECCCVCLIDFRPDAEINHLSCGHVFHKSCLEKWLKYWNTTCPLCRNHLIINQYMMTS